MDAGQVILIQDYMKETVPVFVDIHYKIHQMFKSTLSVSAF